MNDRSSYCCGSELGKETAADFNALLLESAAIFNSTASVNDGCSIKDFMEPVTSSAFEPAVPLQSEHSTSSAT